MPKLDLTPKELREVRDCLIISREWVQEELCRYSKGDRDYESYAKAERLLKSILAKIEAATKPKRKKKAG